MLEIQYLLICFLFTILLATCENKLNILWIIADDLRPALGCYKNDVSFQIKTPNIDQLASKSFLFQNAFAQTIDLFCAFEQALCGPSRTSFLTSRRPDTLRTYENSHAYWRDFVGNFTTLPQYLKDHGYYTISAGKVFHPGRLSNRTDDMPYSWSQKPFHPSTQKFKMSKVCPNPGGTLAMNLVCPVNVTSQPHHTLPDIQTAEYVIHYLQHLQNDHKPFMLAVGLHKPHIPLKYPHKFKDLYPLDEINLAEHHKIPQNLPDVAWNPFQDLRERDDVSKLNISFPYGPIPHDYQKRIRQSYYASVTYIDSLVGSILKALGQSQAERNTAVVISSDHGWSLGEHGEWSKYSNFGVALRVPLIMFIPGLSSPKLGFQLMDSFHYTADMQKRACRKRKVISAMVELIDLFPTFVDILGLPRIPICPVHNASTLALCTEGRSLYSIMKSIRKNKANQNSKLPDGQCILAQFPRPSKLPQLNSDNMKWKDLKIMGYTIRCQNYQYTEWVSFDVFSNSPDWDLIYAKELYDLLNDPGENNNVVDKKQYSYIQRHLADKLRNR